MGFGNFKTDAEVAEKFNLIIKEGFFIETLPFKIPENKRDEIKELLDDPLAYVSEPAICEDIIKPILRTLVHLLINSSPPLIPIFCCLQALKGGGISEQVY